MTVNDYLAQRDSQWMGLLFNYLDLSVGCLLDGMSPQHRKEAYSKDITYGTNSQFGFDYLRDNMAQEKNEKVQKNLTFAIVDEVDNILIDEARTPLIISGPAPDKTQDYKRFSNIASKLKLEEDYQIDAKRQSIALTEKGIDKVEKQLSVENLYSEEITHDERDMFTEEYNSLYEEIDFVLDNTEYDGVRLLDGSFGTRNLTIDNDDSMDITLSDITEEGMKIGAYSRTLEAGDVLIGQDNPNGGVYTEGDVISYGRTSIDSVQDAQDAVARLDDALVMLDEEASEIGAKSQRLDFTVSHLSSMIGNLEMSIDTITDFDEAEHMSRLAQYQIRQQSAIAMMVQAQQLSQTIHQLLNQ